MTLLVWVRCLLIGVLWMIVSSGSERTPCACCWAAPAAPGQSQFLCLPGPGDSFRHGSMQLFDGAGVPVPWARLALKTLTLTRSTILANGSCHLQFLLTGYPQGVWTDVAGGVNALPMLHPILEDDTVKTLRAHYAGHRVWCYPGTGETLYATADPGTPGSIQNDLSISYRVSQVLRVRDLPQSRPLGLRIGAWVGEEGSTYSFQNPIILVFDQPRLNRHWKSQNRDAVKVFVNGKPYPPPPAASVFGNKYLHAYAEFAGGWDLERAFSLVPPFRSRPSPRLHHAILQQVVEPGMTPDMVAWTIGWPDELGTVAQLRTESQWHYDNLSPFQFIVTFRKGKVTSAAPNGTLP